MHLLLDQLTETGAMGGQTLFVLNNIFARDLLRRARHRDGARRVDRAATCRTTRSSYLKAANEGIPRRDRQPEVAGRGRFRDLADIVLGPVAAAATNGASPEPAKEKKGLFGRRR